MKKNSTRRPNHFFYEHFKFNGLQFSKFTSKIIISPQTIFNILQKNINNN